VTAASLSAAAAALLGVLGVRELLGPLLGRTHMSAARFRPLSALLARIGSLGLLRRLTPSRDLPARLSAAGRPAAFGPREWTAVKAGCAVLASMSSIAVLAAGPGRLTTLLALAGPVVGFAAPDFWLARAVRVRSEAAVRELPDMIDLLRVSVQAGVAPLRAMGSVAAEFDGPLATEWRRAAAAVALGEPQMDAIAAITERIAADEVRVFADALMRSRRHGLPLAATLATQAASAREARRRRIRERAARAGPKMQLVVALVLVPSMLLIVTALLAAELQPALGLGAAFPQS
jgi:tight adherence protein C